MSAIIEKIDCFNYFYSDEDNSYTLNEKDTTSAVQDGVMRCEKIITAGHWAISGLKYTSYFCYFIDQNLHFGSLHKISPFLQTAACIGICAAALTFVSESIALIRQQIFLSVFKNRGNEEGESILKQVEKYKKSEMKKILPIWLYEEIYTKNVNNHLNLLEKMKKYTIRKQIVSALGWISAVLGIIAFVGVFIAFPPAGIAPIFIFSMVFAMAKITLKRGWVENPDKGISWRLCLPEFVRKGLKKTLCQTVELQSLKKERVSALG